MEIKHQLRSAVDKWARYWPRGPVRPYVLSALAYARTCGVSPSWNRGEPRRHDLLWLPCHIYIDYWTPRAKMERHLRPYALSRRACERRDPSSCRYFSMCWCAIMRREREWGWRTGESKKLHSTEDRWWKSSFAFVWFRYFYNIELIVIVYYLSY